MKLHMDLDCYFVSAERTRNPYLIGKNVVVAKSGDSAIFSTDKKDAVITPPAGAFNSIFQIHKRYDGFNPNTWRKEFVDEKGYIHGIVIAKSYEAKRYGIKTGTPLNEALYMCKDLIVIPSDHLFYQTMSYKLKTYLESVIPVVEQYSIDEFFGDLTGYIKEQDVYNFINDIQKQITEKFNLPITIGAAPSKWTAKLLTDRHKPYGLKVLQDTEVENYLQGVDIAEFAGVGKATEQKLRRYGCNKIGEVEKVKALLYSFGKTGKDLYLRLKGADNEAVVPSSERKSIGISRNFPPILDRAEVERRFIILSKHLSFSVKELGLNPTTFYYKIRYEDYSKSKISISHDIEFSEKALIQISLDALKQIDIYRRSKIRFIAISVSNFSNQTLTYKLPYKHGPVVKLNNLKTLDMFDSVNNFRNRNLDCAIHKIRKRYGIDMIVNGREMIC